VITIDPPPPVEAAGSSLLYSKQFYAEAKRHLRSDGILQQWLPRADPFVRSSVAQAIQASFSYVRVFHSVNGAGYHFVASDWRLPRMKAHDLAGQLPTSAARDFIEWGPASTVEGQFEILLANEISIEEMIAKAPHTPVLEDNRPANEYFAWRAIHDNSIGTMDQAGEPGEVHPVMNHPTGAR
jgi:spermidine synthase